MFKINKMDFLIGLYILCIAISELMGAKTFPVIKLGTFQLNASVAIFVIPIIYSINDVITEVFGKERTKSIVRTGLVMIIFILLFSFLATSLSPSKRFLTTENAYDMIFQFSIRISAASLTAFALSEFLDIYIFAKLREKLGKKSLWLRNNLSNFVSEFTDSAIFITLAFYALNKPVGDNLTFILSIAIPYWVLKCFMSIIETPFVYLGVSWLKNEKK